MQKMTHNDKICLQWNDFQKTVVSSFRSLREERECTDVTLACEDGQQVGAHKVVLKSSSRFFRELLKSNKYQQPIIYMRRVNFEDLIAILDFLYLGEANLYQEKLESFLTIANELKLKGLAKDWENSEKNESRKDSKEDHLYHDAEYSQQIERTGHALVPLKQDPNNSVVKSTLTADPDQLDEQIDSMMEATENFVTRKCGTRQKAFLCNVCGKLDGRTDLKRHIESAHITAITHSCDICGKTSKSRKILRQHKLREHQKALEAFEGANTEAWPELSLEVA